MSVYRSSGNICEQCSVLAAVRMFVECYSVNINTSEGNSLIKLRTKETKQIHLIVN